MLLELGKIKNPPLPVVEATLVYLQALGLVGPSEAGWVICQDQLRNPQRVKAALQSFQQVEDFVLGRVMAAWKLTHGGAF